MISEEDKSSATSIDYWFRCLDLDGDGVVSIYEMQYFFEEQLERMEKMVTEPVRFEDCLCQMQVIPKFSKDTWKHKRFTYISIILALHTYIHTLYHSFFS